MVRRIILMLIALLALQSSWAAVSAYCMHETGRAANHWGHHPDTNASDEVTSALKEKQSDTKKSSMHAHCASCVHNTLSLNKFEGILHPQIAEAAPIPPEIILPSYFKIPPERPQWTASA